MTAAGKGADRARGSLWTSLEAEPSDIGLVVEAAFALLIAQGALRTLSLRTVVDLCGRVCSAAGDRVPPARRPPPDPLHRLAWAVDAASARAGGACLVRSVALLALLARRGVAAELCIAFCHRGSPPPGHAWVEVDGIPLGADGRAVGPDHPSGFEVLSRLSAGAP